MLFFGGVFGGFLRVIFGGIFFLRVICSNIFYGCCLLWFFVEYVYKLILVMVCK